MRAVLGCAILSMALLAAPSHASNTFAVEKVKTGILPSGEFYSLYQVDCPDKNAITIASLDRSTRWCTLQEGKMNCFARMREASSSACMSGALAAADENIDSLDQYQ